MASSDHNSSNNKLLFETPTSSLSTHSTKNKQPRQQQQHQQPQFPFELLPDLCLDKILKLLEPQDLRSVHQVSKAWQNTLRCRPRIDSRRIDLVTKIRLNKENIITKGCSISETVTPCLQKYSGDTKNHDGKPGSRTILRTVSNSRPCSTISSCKKPIPRSSSTPTSRFLQEYEAGSKLLKGQVLFRCPECSGPVPSPVANRKEGSGFRRITDITTPCKIISGATSTTTTNSYTSASISQSDSGFESICSSTSLSSLSSSEQQQFQPQLLVLTPISLDEEEDKIKGHHRRKEDFERGGAEDDGSNNNNNNTSDISDDKREEEILAEEEDISTDEIAVSFIATPQSSSSGSLSSASAGRHVGLQRQRLDLITIAAATPTTSSSITTILSQVQEEDSSSSENVSFNISSCSSVSSSRNMTISDPESVTECPKCSYRFCCNCKCTEHPGRPCKEITGDSLLFSDNSNSLGNNKGNNSNNTSKSKDKAKRSKKDLRRLARV